MTKNGRFFLRPEAGERQGGYMATPFFYGANVLLLASCLASLLIANRERLVTLSVLQVLAVLPLQAGFYLYFGSYENPAGLVQLLHVSESVFAVLWLGLCYRLGRITAKTDHEPWPLGIIQCAAGGLLSGAAIYSGPGHILVYAESTVIIIDHFGRSYFYALFLLMAILFSAWQLELFWRALEPARRWAYKFFLVGGFVLCGALGWAASYRLTYLRFVAEHFYLLAGLMLIALFFMIYAMARHKLLNRKIFISRKIVYTFVAPTVFAVYLFSLGIVGLIMRLYGWSLPYVIYWLAVVLGAVAVGVFVFSPGLRRRVKFFISTHFYVNKYEYRDEWLALSVRLKGAETESDVVEAVQQVMAGSLYASRIFIWSGDREHGYRLLSAHPPESVSKEVQSRYDLLPDDPLVLFFSAHNYINLQQKNWIAMQTEVAELKGGFFQDLNIVFITPMSIGEQLVGLIGLGPEFTGSVYGHDDYDLLIALGSQAAAALMAVRMAEKLAEARERRAWDRLSAFVLHDIKNAATMLSLVRSNAPAHIEKPDFQQEMLEVIDDALGRMGKVQQRLNALKAEIKPNWREIDLQRFLEDTCRKIARKIKGIQIEFNCPDDIRIKSDPDLFFRVLENLILNAFEAAEESSADGSAIVRIDVVPDAANDRVALRVTDNGPGIDPALLPNMLFEPFRTTRETGSGIGLWQVRHLVTSLGGTVRAENAPGGGASFEIGFAS